MNVSVMIGDDIEVDCEDDAGYNPDVAQDMLSQCVSTAVRIAKELSAMDEPAKGDG